MSKSIKSCLGSLVAAVLLASGGGAALAASPVGVNLTFEGCRNNGNITLPNAGGQFICPDAAYTTGNLGKGWNELDLVPHRITLAAGNSAPNTQTYRLAVAVDHIESGIKGYDVLSAPVKNTSKSAASCAITVTPVAAVQASTLTPGIGGTDTTMYRFVDITQNKGTTCVFDFYARLALGSHEYPGSSLHANTFNETFGTGGIGARDISIPVKEILPQDLNKTMSALADSDFSWSVEKTGPAGVDFGDVCRADAVFAKPASIKVTWVKSAATTGMINIKTIIQATNPAARSIIVNVTDKIYKGVTPTTQIGETGTSGPKIVPANQTVTVLTHEVIVSAAVAGNIGESLNDVAEATYTDEVTGVAIPGKTTATASTTIQTGGNISNNSASIADSESITGTDLSFAVGAPLPAGASVPPGYVAGTKVTALDWLLGGQTASGSMTFAKTIHLASKRVVSGVLSDQAGLTGSNGFSTTSDELKIPVTSSATVAIKGTKTIPVGLLTTGQTLVVKFSIKGIDDPTTTAEKTVTFAATDTSKTFEFSGLKPDAYDVTEVSALVNGTTASGLEPEGGATKQVNLRLGTDGAVNYCDKPVTFNNLLGGGAPKVQVNKVTDPTTLGQDDPTKYTFKLYGPPNATTLLSKVDADANGASQLFPVVLELPGDYKVVEDPLPLDPWFYFSKSSECTFTLVFPDSFTSGKTYSCTYTNKKKGDAKVIKTVSSEAPSGTQSFTFELRKDATVYASGTTLETKIANAGNGGLLTFTTLLMPGTTYQMCESNMLPGWQSTLAGFVPDSLLLPDNSPNPGVDNSVRCVNFTPTAGSTTTFTVDNTPPPQGDARTIGFWKNHASCNGPQNKTNAQKLDETLFASTGILKPTKIDSLTVAVAGPYGLYGQSQFSTVDCPLAVSLLDKRSFNGQKKASDPLFNMAAQLVAAELNVVAGANACIVPTINDANTLLGSRNFDGNNYSGGKLSAAEANYANSLATLLDKYNNNVGCQ